jgi:hypothetical protein
MLLYLVKYSRPDLANAVRELSKAVQAPNEASWKEMLRVIKFTLDSKDYGLKLEPNQDMLTDESWELMCYSDSDWAGDKESRKSITGYVLFVMGCPVVWKSKQQNVVGLSSSEAELYACIDAVKAVRYVVQILLSMNISVKLPVVVRVDNTGAIFMAENLAVSQRTKHIDLRARYLLNQVVDEELIKLVFVGTADNLSDGMTKNVTREVYEATSGAYISVRDYWNISQITARKGVGDHDSAVTEMIQSTHEMIHSNQGSSRVNQSHLIRTSRQASSMQELGVKMKDRMERTHIRKWDSSGEP